MKHLTALIVSTFLLLSACGTVQQLPQSQTDQGNAEAPSQVIVATSQPAKRVAGNVILDEAGQPFVSFNDPDLRLAPGMSPQSYMHVCTLGPDGPYRRKQSDPAVAVNAAFIKGIVTLPDQSSFTYPSDLSNNPTPHMYLGGRANAIGGMAMDAGLAFDKTTNTWAVILAWNDGTRHDESTRVNGQPLRIAPNQDVVMKFFVDANQQPVLTVTASHWYTYSSYPSTKTESFTSTTFVFRASQTLSGWSNSPGTATSGYGQPLKAMTSLALNNVASVSDLATRTDSYRNLVYKQYVLGKITGYNSANDPAVSTISTWYNAGDTNGDCKTNYIFASPTLPTGAAESWDIRFK